MPAIYPICYVQVIEGLSTTFRSMKTSTLFVKRTQRGQSKHEAMAQLFSWNQSIKQKNVELVMTVAKILKCVENSLFTGSVFT